MGEVAAAAHLPTESVEPYGADMAKISLDAIDAMQDRPAGRYIVVSAITPTPLGEGKTTTAVGLAQAFRHLGKTATLAIRQPSMGPTFGIKGGAAGGGYSQVVPMQRLNLHLTGDMHAVTAANNLCAAALDASLYHGNPLGLDLPAITWRRVMDVNDRALRNVVIGLGGRVDGVPRQTGFDITAASEVMAALALATSLADLRARLGRITVGATREGTPVTAEELEVAGAMAVMLLEAIKPNLMQTLENTPALVHAGPFGNIATGNSSIVADLIGIRTSDYLITEAGFGADMGAERFFNIKCRTSGMPPDAAVVVATVRGLKAHSGKHRIVAGRPLPDALLERNPDEVRQGGENLRRQLDVIRMHGPTPVVAVNAFPDDHVEDLAAVQEIADEFGARAVVSRHFTDGGSGAVELARAVAEAAEHPGEFRLL
ncbi:MAG: formate--tetrahydrofolate ligase, partial [Acidimicrobiales bacterium]